MPKFEIEIENIKYKTVEIEAESIEEAIKIATDQFHESKILLDEVNCDESNYYIRGVFNYDKEDEEKIDDETWNENYEWKEL